MVQVTGEAREAETRESACLSNETLVDFLEKRASAGMRTRVEEHAARCRACRSLLSALAREGTPLPYRAGDDRALAPGTQVGRYVIERQIGTGAMGVIYAARDPDLDRVVAVKLLRDGDLRTHDRLRREAQAMAQLAHPNVVAVHDVGVHGERMFIAMEHVAGTTLARWLSAPRSPCEILDAYRAAGGGLAAAHAAGIVHRDFKPENVLVGSDGRVRVVDFGLARAAHTVDPRLDATLDGAAAAPRSAAGAPANLTLSGALVGTPYYIAPELYGGAEADARSDQFSFCVALFTGLYGARPFDGDSVDALAENVRAGRVRKLPATPRVARRIRAAILRGLAVDPHARFASLDELLAALAPPRHRARWALGLVAAVASIAALVLSAQPTGEVLDCEPDPARLSARWDADRLAAVTHVLAALPGSRAAVDRIVSDIVTQQGALDANLAGACRAVRTHALTRDQYLTRASCLQRRYFTLTATVDLLRDAPINLLKARDRLETSVLPDDCVEMTAAPIAGDAAAAEALWRRYVRSGILADPRHTTEHIAELTAIAAAAAEINETELVARSTRWLAVEQRIDGHLAQADETFQRAYRMALDLKAHTLAAQLLVDRSHVALLREDTTAARNYAELARDLADTQATSPRVQASITLGRARARNADGDHAGALELLRRALDILTRDGLATSTLELDVRQHLLATLMQSEVQAPETIALASETAELIRALVGEHDRYYASALHILAAALSVADAHVRAAEYRRRAIEILRDALPAAHTFQRQVRNWLVIDLYNIGDLEAAQRQIAELSAIRVKYVRSVWHEQAFFALIAFERGNLEDSFARATQAQDEAISAHGKNHPDTLEVRYWVAAMALELGRLDAAARNIAAIEVGYRAQPDPDTYRLRLSRLSGRLAAELAIARGNPREAEAAARHALGVAVEMGAGDRDRAHFHASLGKSLVAQRRWAEARTALDTSLALLRKAQGRRDDIAAVEIELALAEAGLDQTGRALARARRARAVLDEHYPGRLRARAQTDRLLGKRLARR